MTSTSRNYNIKGFNRKIQSHSALKLEFVVNYFVIAKVFYRKYKNMTKKYEKNKEKYENKGKNIKISRKYQNVSQKYVSR